jgi:hypothetical protein
VKTVTLRSLETRWHKIRTECGVELLSDLIYDAARRHRSNERAKLEPTDGPIAILKTGAKLYWSDSRGVYILSGYAHDGRDVDPYLYKPLKRPIAPHLFY